MGIKAIVKAIMGAIPKNRHKIIFESNSDFCDNTRAVYNYMVNAGYMSKYTCIWCVKDVSAHRHLRSSSVKFTSFTDKRYRLSYLYHLSTAKYIFFTHTPPPLMPLKGQVVANLWHGTPLKRLTGFVGDKPRFHSLISASPMVTEVMADSFNLPKESIMLTGYPRNDLLFEDTDALSRIGVERSAYKKVILWMPTFRQSSGVDVFDCKATQTGLPLTATSEQLERLDETLKINNIYMVCKLHPAQDSLPIMEMQFTHLKLLTNAELDVNDVQLYHLVGDADALLTDYSSVYFDYLLLDRPIGFIVDDIDEYTGNRGFIVDNPLELMPGQHIKTMEDLSDFISQVSTGEDNYKQMRAEVNDLVNSYKDAGSSERFLDAIKITTGKGR